MVHALLVFAAEEAEPSKTAFFICGGLLAAWAVVLGFLGLRSPEFPGGQRGESGVITISGARVGDDGRRRHHGVAVTQRDSVLGGPGRDLLARGARERPAGEAPVGGDLRVAEGGRSEAAASAAEANSTSASTRPWSGAAKTSTP